MLASYSIIRFRRVPVEGLDVHVQEAGDPSSSHHILLLHGFPSTSRMWDRLIPVLATKYHVIAPDYPGFGLSHAPSPGAFSYTFDNIATAMAALLQQLGISRYSIVMQDYGGQSAGAWPWRTPPPSRSSLRRTTRPTRKRWVRPGTREKRSGGSPRPTSKSSRKTSCRSRRRGSATLDNRPMWIVTTPIAGTTNSGC